MAGQLSELFWNRLTPVFAIVALMAPGYGWMGRLVWPRQILLPCLRMSREFPWFQVDYELQQAAGSIIEMKYSKPYLVSALPEVVQMQRLSSQPIRHGEMRVQIGWLEILLSSFGMATDGVSLQRATSPVSASSTIIAIRRHCSSSRTAHKPFRIRVCLLKWMRSNLSSFSLPPTNGTAGGIKASFVASMQCRRAAYCVQNGVTYPSVNFGSGKTTRSITARRSR